MHKQIKNYFEQSKYSTCNLPIQRVNSNGFNSGMKLKSFNTQVSKQSTVQFPQDSPVNNPLEINSPKILNLGREQSDSNSRKNSKAGSIKRENSIVGDPPFSKQNGNIQILENIKILQSSQNEQAITSPTQQGPSLIVNRIARQKSRVYNHQPSYRYLNTQGNEQITNKQSSFLSPSTVIFAYNDKSQLDQEDRLQKKKKKIKDVLIGKSKEEVFAKGLRHFRDAHLLRPPRNIFDRDQIVFGKYFLLFYELRWTIWWRILQRTLSYLFIIQSFLEPQTLAQKFFDDSVASYIYCQEIVVLSFCLLDNILSLYLFRSTQRNNIFKFISFTSQFSIIIIFFVDFIIFWHTSKLGIRFSAFLRPIWLIQFHPDIYKTLKSIFLSFKKVIDIFLFFIFISCFWGYMGYNLFSEYTAQFLDDKYFVFGSVGESILGIYTLISMDSYPSIMKNIVIDNPYYLIYFVPFVCFNLFFLLFIPVAVIFENYKQQRAGIILKDDKIIKEGLIYSFYCLTHYKQEDHLSKEEFFALLNSFYKNKAIKEKIDNLYDILNIDIQDQLSLGEFLDVIDLMKSSERLYDNSYECWDWFRNITNKYLHFDQISKSNYWNYFILFIVSVNTIMIIVYSVLPQQDQTDNLDELLTNIDIVFNSIYILDVIIKIIGLGINEYFNDQWNNFDFIMVMISIITIFGLKYIYFLKQAKSTKLIKLTKLQKVLKIFRSIRSLKLFKILKLGADALLRVQKLFHKVALCIPSIYGLTYTYFLFSFSYAIIGTYLFNTDYNEFNQSQLRFYPILNFLQKRDGSPYSDNTYTDFNSIFGALLSLLQVITQSKWIDFLYGYGYKFNLGLSTAYFCFYHMFSILFFMSLIRGMIWDVFNVVENYFKEQEIEEIGSFYQPNSQSQQQIDEDGGIHYEVTSHKERIQTQQNDYPSTPSRINKQFQRVSDIQSPNQRGVFLNFIKNDVNFQADEEKSMNQTEQYSTIPNENYQRPRMSTYHYMKQEMQDKGMIKMKTSEGKKQKKTQDRLQELNEKSFQKEEEEKSKNHSEQMENKKSDRNISSMKKLNLPEITLKKVNPQNSKSFQKIISYKDVTYEEIAEEQQKNNEGDLLKAKIKAENKFVVRFNYNGGELDSDNFNVHQILSPQLIQTPSSSPLNILLSMNYEETSDQLLNSNSPTKQNQNQNQQNASYKANNSTMSSNHTQQQISPEKQNSNSKKSILEKRNQIFINKVSSPEASKEFLEDQKIEDFKIEKKAPILSKSNLLRRNFSNQLELPGTYQKNDVIQIPNIQKIDIKKPQNSIRRSESSFISRDQDKLITTPYEKIENSFDKYYEKRAQIIVYEMDLISELNQLEKFLKLYDQVGLRQAELRKNRIANKHQNMNHFSISKQHALQKMTYLKDHPSNFLYSNRQNYLKASELLIEHSNHQNGLQQSSNKIKQYSHGQFKIQNLNHTQNQGNRKHSSENQNVPNMQLINNSNSPQQHIPLPHDVNAKNIAKLDNSIKCLNKNNNQQDQIQFSLSDVDDIESIQQQKAQKQFNINQKNYHGVQFTEETSLQQSITHDNSMNESTFLRLNNIFSFLLHILTNSVNLDCSFLVSKLFIIEQSINQLIFGTYNENHTVNHFKFIFYSPSQNRYITLIKQRKILNSKEEIDENCFTGEDEPIEVCSLSSELAPWSAIGKSLKHENKIYFIKSLFSAIENNQEKDIAYKLSDYLQFMRGYEYCTVDLTKHNIEQYVSFIYSKQSNASQFSTSQRSNAQSNPYIAFICNRLTNQQINITNHYFVNKSSNCIDTSNNHANSKQNYLFDKSLGFPRQSSSLQNRKVKNNKESDEKQNQNNIHLRATEDTLNPNAFKQYYRSESKYRNPDKNKNISDTNENQLPKKVDDNNKNDTGILNRQVRIESHSQNHQQHNQLEKSNNIELDNLQKSTQIKNFERSNRRNISQIIENKNKVKLQKEQEHVIKIYHQIQSFFQTHSHLFQSIILRLQSQVSQHLPSYENN